MRKLTILVLAAGLIAVPSMAIGGVATTPHDMRSYSGGGTVTQELCFSCHIPHDAGSANLWARTATNPGGFTAVQTLCYSCHDGDVASVGLTTAFDNSLEQHKGTNSADCSGDGACHDVHNQVIADNKFLVTGVAKTNGSYCWTCHDDAAPTGFTNSHGDHTTAANHRGEWDADGPAGFLCEQCHSVHGATPQGVNPAGLTNPILLANNEATSSYYGAFCISCHNNVAPAAAVPGTGGQKASDVFDYAEGTADGTELKHPTTTTASTIPVGGCDKCHDVHNPGGTDHGYILNANNDDSAYCVSCHNGTDGPSVTDGGGGTHYTGVPVGDYSGRNAALYWSADIDDDGVVGADYAGATAGNYMVCETCHSVHRKGAANGGPLLRFANTTANEICTQCHAN